MFRFHTASCTRIQVCVSVWGVLRYWFSGCDGGYLIEFCVCHFELIDMVIAIDEMEYFLLGEVGVRCCEWLLEGEAGESEIFLYHIYDYNHRLSIKPSVFASFIACPIRSSTWSNSQGHILPCLRPDGPGTNWCHSWDRWGLCGRWCMTFFHWPWCSRPRITFLMRRSWTASCNLSIWGPGWCWHSRRSSEDRTRPWISLFSMESLCLGPLRQRSSWDWRI